MVEGVEGGGWGRGGVVGGHIFYLSNDIFSSTRYFGFSGQTDVTHVGVFVVYLIEEMDGCHGSTPSLVQ